MSKMTKRSAASLVLKLMAVYVVVNAMVVTLTYVRWLAGAIHDLSTLGTAVLSLGLNLLWLAIWLGIGFGLIRLADRVAVRLVPQDEEIGTIAIDNVDTIQAVVFACIGLFIIATAIPSFLGQVATWLLFLEPRTSFEPRTITAEVFGPCLTFAIQAAIGIFLMSRPHHLIVWLKRFAPSDVFVTEPASNSHA